MQLSNRNRITVHLFYNKAKSIGKHIKQFILINVEYEDIPLTIQKIVTEYYNTYIYYEIKTITGIKEEIWVNSKLI